MPPDPQHESASAKGAGSDDRGLTQAGPSPISSGLHQAELSVLMIARPGRSTPSADVIQAADAPSYRLEEQVGFLLRRAHQRATGIFNQHFAEAGLSPVAFAALVKVHDEGRISQNQLGRLVNLDPATAMGVIGRLVERQLIRRAADPDDKRRTLLSITSVGLKLVEDTTAAAHAVTRETMEVLDEEEQATFLRLLTRLL